MITYADIMALEDEAGEAAKALNLAAANLRKARSNFTPKHIAYTNAQNAYEAAMTRVEEARAQMDSQIAADERRQRDQEAEAERLASPSFGF